MSIPKRARRGAGTGSACRLPAPRLQASRLPPPDTRAGAAWELAARCRTVELVQQVVMICVGLPILFYI